MLLLVLDATVVLGWLYFYYDEYERISVVVGGLWGAVMVLLGAVGVRSGETTLSSFVGLPPVRLITVTYTVLLAGAVPFWAAFALPIHRATISLDQAPGDLRWSVRVLVGPDSLNRSSVGGDSVRLFWIRRGSYEVTAVADGYDPVSGALDVPWLALGAHLALPPPRRRTGWVRLSANMDLTATILDAASGAAQRRTVPATGSTFELPPGEYEIVGRAPPAAPDTAVVVVTPGDTVPGSLVLRTSPVLGTLQVRSTPPDLEILLDGRATGARTPWSTRLGPGRYEVVLRQVSPADERFGRYYRGTVQVAASATASVDADVPVGTLPVLTVILGPASTGATLYLDDEVLGEVSQSGVFPVYPGRYRVSKRVQGAVGECGSVTLVMGGAAELRC